MHVRIRSKPTKLFAVFLLIVMCVTMLFSMMHFDLVQAAPNEEIKELIMVGDDHVSYMQSAVANEEHHDGDVVQHQWISPGSNPFGNVLSHISDDKQTAEKQAVVVWLGEKYTTSKIPGYGEWFDNDWLGRDGSNLPFQSANPDDPVSMKSANGDYSGIAVGRALAGYDYYVLEMRTTTGPSQDLIPSDAVHKKYKGQGPADAKQPTENWSWKENQGTELPSDVEIKDGSVQKHYRTEWVTNEETGQLEQVQVFDHYTWEYHHTDSWNYWVEVKVHKKGYAEYWKEKGALVYVAALGPYSKNLEKETKDKENKPVETFNGSLSANAKGLSFLDIYDMIAEQNPYYRTGRDASEGIFYDDPTLQYIFHLIWNTILVTNPDPNQEPPEPLDFSLYAISSSLTSYMNTALSPNADANRVDHKLPEANTMANAGAFLGYGDKDYGFSPFVTTKLSGTASSISYKALLDNRDGGNYRYAYARYGHMLADMGLDETGTAGFGSAGRLLPGVLMYLVFVLSSGVSLVFSVSVHILQIFNPFQFLVHANEIAADWKFNMVANGELVLPGGATINNMAIDFLDFFGDMYDGFYNIGFFVVIPLSLVLAIAGTLLFFRSKNKSRPEYHREDRHARHAIWRSFFVKVVFIAIGVPLLGTLYTGMLEYAEKATEISGSPSTQIVASTFVNFENWAKTYRLNPVEDGLFKTVGQGSAGIRSQAGGVSDEAYNNLRKTTIAINQAGHSIDGVDMSLVSSADNEQEWASRSLRLQAKDWLEEMKIMGVGHHLLTSYMTGSTYTASDFESDTLGVTTARLKKDGEREGKDYIGRLSGKDEDEPVDNTGTMYEFFDNTNELDDWKGRTSQANTEITRGDGSADKWSEFNMLSNGGMRTDTLATSTADSIEYLPISANKPAGYGLDAGHKIGLSTMSLYNYLSTDFGDDSMTIYSNQKTSSGVTKMSHYSVNLIGSGAMSFFYGLNAFAIMGTAAILAICYAIGMMISNIKMTIQFLTELPFALLGVMKSIVQVITMVFLMSIEIIATICAYTLVVQVIMQVGISLENFGTSGQIAAIGMQSMGLTNWLSIAVWCIGLLLLNIALVKWHHSFQRIVYMVRKTVWECLFDVVLMEQIPAKQESVFAICAHVWKNEFSHPLANMAKSV